MPLNVAPDAVDDAYTIHASQISTFIPAPGFLANDSDAEGDAFGVNSINTDGVHGSLSVFLDGSFRFTPEADFVGATSFTYSIGDAAGGVDTATVTINVVNNLILANALSNQNATEAAPLNFTVPASTFAGAGVGEGLILSAALADGSPLPAWLSFNSATGEFTGTPLNGDVGLITVRVTATNAVLESASSEFALTVANTNGNPVIAGDANVSLTIPENSTFVTTVAVTDPDGDSLTYELFGLDADKFVIDAVTHEIRFIASPDFENPQSFTPGGVFDFFLQVTDGNGGVASQAFQITLSDINEAPSEVVVGRVLNVGSSGVVPAGYVISDPVRVGRIIVQDDQLGTNIIGLSGADADKFALVTQNDETFLVLLPEATAALANPNTLNVTINVYDPTLGGSIDASTTFEFSSIALPEPDDSLPLVGGIRPTRVVTYSFEDGRRNPGQFSGSGEFFTADDRLVAREALASWDDASGLVFLEVPLGLGDIRFYVADLQPVGLLGVADFVGGNSTNISMDVTARTDFWIWSHEIGHALGLFHSFADLNGPGVGPGFNPLFDTTDFTVMSYTQGLQAATSIGYLDQYAAQFLYGGPDLGTYTFNQATLTLHYVGSDAADDIYGNRRLVNILDGGAGDDTLNAFGPSNQLTGGAGNDELRMLSGSRSYTAVYSGLVSDYTFDFVGGSSGDDPSFVQITDRRDQSPDGSDRLFDNGRRFLDVAFEFAGEQKSFAQIFDIRPIVIEFTINGVDPVGGFSVAEDASFGTILGSILQVVMQFPAGLTNLPAPIVSMSTDANFPFWLQGNDLIVAGVLDFETVQSYDFVVRATDFYGGVYEETVHVDVTDFRPTILGTPDDDDNGTNPAIFGSIENDLIFGLEGNDVIFQGLGSDDVDGGDGLDTFSLFFALADYTIVQNVDGSVAFSYDIEITDVGHFAGTDTLRNVEAVIDAAGVTTLLSEFFNDDPTAAAINAVTTDEDTASAAVAIGAVDADGDTLLYAVKTGFAPAKGVVNFSGDSFVFTPNLNANGADSFVIEISDGNGGTAEQAVSVTIESVNDAPTANPDTGSVGENETKSFLVLDNDTDPDLDDGKTLVSIGAVTVSSGNALVNGLIAASALSMVGNQIQFSPGTLFDPLDSGETATVTVNYTMRDAAGAASSSALTLTINGAADAPVFNIISGTRGNDGNLNGTGAADQINGLAGNDSIDAKGGGDLIIAGAGNDKVSAGGGNDTIVATINDGNDKYEGGAGNDTVDFSAITVALNIDLRDKARSAQTGTDRLDSIENAIGGSGNDIITGDGAANVLDGGAGQDTISANGGNDTVIGGLGNDIMNGGTGDDTFIFKSGFGNDRITGFDANPAGGQDHLDLRSLGITSANFDVRVFLSDLGTDTLVTIDNNPAQTIRLVGIDNLAGIKQEDFFLL